MWISEWANIAEIVNKKIENLMDENESMHQEKSNEEESLAVNESL